MDPVVTPMILNKTHAASSYQIISRIYQINSAALSERHVDTI